MRTPSTEGGRGRLGLAQGATIQLLQGKLCSATQAVHHASPAFAPELLHVFPLQFPWHQQLPDGSRRWGSGILMCLLFFFFFFFGFVFGDIFKPKFYDLKIIYIDCCVDFYIISPEFHAQNLTRFLDCFTLVILS